MRFPWTKIEKRADLDATALAVQALQDAASGNTVSSAIAAIEVCKGLWGRAFASARIEPDNAITCGLTPEIMELIGRSLISPGELVLEIVVEDGELMLLPASSTTISSGPLPASWLYQINLSGPSSTESRVSSSTRVVHLKYSVDAERPWQGVGPLKRSELTCTLAGALETALRQEAGGSVGSLIPVPPAKDLSTLQTQIRALKGRTALLDTTSGGFDQGSEGAPKTDWDPKRLAPSFTQAEVLARDSVVASILGACGVPVSMLGKADGTLSRESYRQFVTSSVGPIAKVAQKELADKLDTPDLSLDFTDLRSADIMGRARAYASMVGAGLSPDQAGDIAGLFEGS